MSVGGGDHLLSGGSNVHLSLENAIKRVSASDSGVRFVVPAPTVGVLRSLAASRTLIINRRISRGEKSCPPARRCRNSGYKRRAALAGVFWHSHRGLQAIAMRS
ncbi:hypothetical protein EVAR_62833_1 [Eumeta japonica]|uniref:Uncharacterized protein n=1 Tax=Eumeta variegata TaxID=151549 RepID=A0A4C1ZF26_EUMVA|nr:hypothetical protein EVAR_62833_1 [Eumeta japonica]